MIFHITGIAFIIPCQYRDCMVSDISIIRTFKPQDILICRITCRIGDGLAIHRHTDMIFIYDLILPGSRFYQECKILLSDISLPSIQICGNDWWMISHLRCILICLIRLICNGVPDIVILSCRICVIDCNIISSQLQCCLIVMTICTEPGSIATAALMPVINPDISIHRLRIVVSIKLQCIRA